MNDTRAMDLARRFARDPNEGPTVPVGLSKLLVRYHDALVRIGKGFVCSCRDGLHDPGDAECSMSIALVALGIECVDLLAELQG